MYVDNVLIYQQSVFKISFQPPKEMNCNQLFPRSYHRPVHRKDSTDKKKKDRYDINCIYSSEEGFHKTIRKINHIN